MLSINPALLERLPAKYAHHYQVIPLEWTDGVLTIGVENPYNLSVIDELELMLECTIKAEEYSASKIKEALQQYYGVGAEMLHLLEPEAKEKQIEISESEKADEPSIVRFVNELIQQAYRDRATDIHLEPYEGSLVIRFRIDGILYDIPGPAQIKHWQQAISSRLKIMAQLDIAEKRKPQDGRIIFEVEKEQLDLRISILPSPHGESIVIRLLRKDMLISLTELGMSERELKTVEKILAKPHGILFVTGPTGSGKTTTLYACLNQLRIPDRKIITVEDPIEYELERIVQTQVVPKIGFSFAAGLRSMLRHDPDVMMVGEVRDLETAEIAIRSALTGHLILSTLHTNDAAGAITRLVDMQVEPFLVASAVECVIAQRLVRVICSHCREKVKPDPAIFRNLPNKKELMNGYTFYEGKGCAQCRNTGYWGRTAIYESIEIDNDLRKLVVQKEDTGKIRKNCMDRGMRSLRGHGWEKVKKGITTIAEVLRVTPSDEEL